MRTDEQTRVTRRQLGLVIATCAALLTPGCTPKGDRPDSAEWVEPAAAGPLEEVPFPGVDGLEETVRTQLLDAREALAARLAEPDTGVDVQSRAYGGAGMIHHAYQMLDAAGACYRNAQRLDPGEFSWPYYLGRALESLDESTAAAAAYRRALELRPDYVPALVALGREELAQNRPDAAEALFRRAVEAEPAAAAALVGLGKVAAARRDYAAAADWLERARALQPGATEIFYPLGIAYRELGRGDEARALLEQAGDVPVGIDDPLMQRLASLAGGWRIQLNRGTALFQAGRIEEGLEQFRKAAEVAPDQPMVRTNLGSALVRLDRPEEARKEFEEALRLDPKQTTALFNLGVLLARQGDDARAAELYRRALEVDPRQLAVHFNLANALRRLGRFDEAAGHYRAVVEGDPGRVEARLGEVYALVRLERYAQALERLDQAAAAVPGDAEVRHALARVLAAAPVDGLRDGPRALQLADGLLAEQPSLPWVVATAMAAAEAGQYDRAVRLQEDALAAARNAGRGDLVAGLAADLERYRRGEPCRRPWRLDDPVLSPRSLDR